MGSRQIAQQNGSSEPGRESSESARSRRLFEMGIDHYNAGRYYTALDLFRRLKGYGPDRNPLLTASYLLAMKSYFQIGRGEDAADVGREFLTRFPRSSYRDDIHECFGDIFVRGGRYRSAVQSYLTARLQSDSDSTVVRLDQKLRRLGEGLLSEGEISDLLVTELNPSSRAILTVMLADRLLAQGHIDRAVLTLFRMDLASLPLSFEDFYASLKSRSYQDGGEGATVGVVLPLSGYNESAGTAFLNGIQEAVETLRDKQSLNIDLEIIDNSGDDIGTVASVQVLAANPNVVAAIGPLSTVNSVTAATAAMSVGLPLLVPVSTQVGLGGMGQNVFQMNVDLYRQGRYAADYAVSSLGLKTLAVLAPADRFGKNLADGFVQRASDLGADIVAVEWYSGIPVDLSDQFSSLRKTAFRLSPVRIDMAQLGLRLDSLDNTFDVSEEDFFPEEEDVARTLTRSDSSEIVLSSIEGIYLPIHLGDINYVASQFSSYYLDSQLLGNTNWYDPEVLDQEMIGPNVNGMVVLADHLNPLDRNEATYAEASNLEVEDRPEYKMALFGYDIMTFLAAQLGEDATRRSVLENLQRAKSFRGMAKLISFSGDRDRVNSSLYILEYRDGDFITVGEVNSDSLLTYTVQSP
ncbi:MAG: ABC transporter substrate-binding protein [Fidelibacterota bacterium]